MGSPSVCSHQATGGELYSGIAQSCARLTGQTSDLPQILSYYVSGPVRFPVDLRLYRRYEDLTQWEAFVQTHFPDRPIPAKKKERAQLHKAIDPVLLQDPAFEKLHQQFRTKIDLGITLLEAAIQHKLPFRILLFDSWYLAEELVAMARYG